MNLDSASVGLFIKEFAAYGFWGLFAFVFIIWGMPHVAPIVTAIGAIFNERQKSNLSHERSMKKLNNKKSQDLVGKGKVK